MTYRTSLKRILDLLLSSVAFILLLPAFVTIYLLSWILYRENPLFVQQRPGYKGKIFSIIKFKSMRDINNAKGNPLPDAERLTELGKFLRKTSLDEIPQLINVIKGDMSLIGPRPLFVSYLPYYTDREARRHNVRPGITGLAQVSGRNSLFWDQRLELDVQYVENLSLRLDAQIFFKTIQKVIKGSDIKLIPDEERNLDTYRKSVAVFNFSASD